MRTNHYHNHDQFTGVNTHNHTHPHTPQAQVNSPGYVQVHTTPSYGSYQNTHYHSYSSGRGGRILLIGGFVLLPILIVATVLQLTLGTMGVATTATLTTAGAAGAGAAGAIAFSAATFGIGGLVLYGALGLAFLYSSAKECYNSDKNVFDMIKSRVVNEDGVSFKGIMKSIGAVLWSPFLLIGGLAGMGVKAVVNACASKSPPVKKDESGLELKEFPYSKMSRDSSSKPENRNEVAPIHTGSPISRTSSNKTEVDKHLLDSKTSFTPLNTNSLYPTL